MNIIPITILTIYSFFGLPITGLFILLHGFYKSFTKYHAAGILSVLTIMSFGIVAYLWMNVNILLFYTINNVDYFKNINNDNLNKFLDNNNLNKFIEIYNYLKKKYDDLKKKIQDNEKIKDKIKIISDTIDNNLSIIYEMMSENEYYKKIINNDLLNINILTNNEYLTSETKNDINEIQKCLEQISELENFQKELFSNDVDFNKILKFDTNENNQLTEISDFNTIFDQITTIINSKQNLDSKIMLKKKKSKKKKSKF